MGRASVPQKDKTLSDEDSEELCALFERVHASAKFAPVKDKENALAGSFAEDPAPFDKKDLIDMANTWAFAEDDPVVLDAEVDDELGIDGAGPVDTGSGDEDEDGEVEDVVAVTPDVGHVSKRGEGQAPISAVQLFDAEECIEQLRAFNRAHNIPSDVAIHVDRYAHSLRRFQMGSKLSTSIKAYFNSN